MTAEAQAEARTRRSAGAVVPMRHSGLVFVLGTDRQPLDPCPAAYARRLLSGGKAAVFRRFPFTIILKERTRDTSHISKHRLKFDPGSKTTGIAIVQDEKKGGKVVFAAELEHRGQMILDSLLARRQVRRSRRSRKTRYRKPRFNNRRRPEGWLAPSLEHRVLTVLTWTRRLRKLCPVASISMELAKFDIQKMEHPEISGIEYQQGELHGYEVREYLLEKWRRACAYCGAQHVPLEIDHIDPKSRGGSNRVSNLTLACRPCNEKKGKRTAEEFGHPAVQAQASEPLKDVAAVNATRWALLEKLKATGLPVECGTGGRTKFNRTRLGLPKTHWIDAACVGAGTPRRLIVPVSALAIKATGHGNRRRCGTDKHGFPIRHKSGKSKHFGFETGDIVRATVPKGKRRGTHTGRVLCRARGSFDIQTRNGKIAGVAWKHCRVLHRKDGYMYDLYKSGASSPRLKAGASAPKNW
jgi:5-methylcytosine-specific restriction endonuclease McrA